MKSIGFLISTKENEKRRAIVFEDLKFYKGLEKYIFFESGYFDVLGYKDEDVLNLGFNIASKEKVLKCDILVDPKIGDASYLDSLKPNQIIFGRIHATQNKNITDKLLSKKAIVYAREKMFYKNRHVFWRNNELAGEAAVMDAFLKYGKLPYECVCAIIGSGNTARGALKVLSMLGSTIFQYTRKTEGLIREELPRYDVIVNCVLWDVNRNDHIIYRTDLKRMKKNALIIDVSCDKNGAIESSIPTSIENPTYTVDGILHYAVDHTPSLFYKSFSCEISNIIRPYLIDLITEKKNEVLEKALIIESGAIIDEEINIFQKRGEMKNA